MRTLTRRHAIGAATAGLFLPNLLRANLARAQSQDGEELIDAFPPPLPQAPDDAPDFSGLELDVQQLGTARPNELEVKVAQRILEESPFATSPLEVARYFQGVGQGSLNGAIKVGGQTIQEVRHYVRGWPIRYNPVIINFFKATNTNPLTIDGDFTSWCAAFINWCIARASATSRSIALDDRGMMKPFDSVGLQKGTRSASSGSFRCWGNAISLNNARPGDVAVWALKGTVNGCNFGKGHVGFFAGRTASGRLKILGGNQKDPTTSHYAVVEKGIGNQFTRSDGLVQFHTIRR